MKRAIVSLLCAAGVWAGKEIPKGYTLVYQQSFASADALKDFTFTDPEAWNYAAEKDGGALALTQQSGYKPPVRSPVNIALLKDKTFKDFVLEADLVQTGKEYGHRDMCLFFGFQSPTQFYYTHLATKADPNAHNIFIVNEKPRTNIAKTTTEGVNWGIDVWHKVRLERKAGTVRVYFDDMTLPIMVAEDQTFAEGLIGFGSFDDTGKVDNIKIWAPESGSRQEPVVFQKAP